MTTQSVFYYPTTVHQDAASNSDVATLVHTLPLDPDNEVVILLNDIGELKQGLYVFLGTHWQFAMPYTEVCFSVIRGDTISVYSNHTDDVTAPAGSSVFKNGVPQVGLNIVHGNAIYAVRTPPAGGGGGSGTVTSVNGISPDMSGNVLLTAANIGGISVVGKTGQYSDIIGAPPAYTLPAATTTTLGGVIVPSASNLTVDGSGHIDIKASLITTINGKFGAATAAGTGISWINNQSGGVLNLKTIKAGTNVTITDDGLGTVTVSSADMPLTPATATGLGGVIVPSASNISVDVSGNIDIKGALLTTINGAVQAVSGNGSGTSLYRQRTGSTAVLKDLVAGANVTITDDGLGNLTIASTGGSPPIASASVLGVIKVGSGLSIDGSGVLSATAGSTTLTGDVTGSGTGSIATTLANSGVTAGTYTKVTVDAKGRVTLGTSLSGSDVNTALGYVPYNGATNPSGYISANQSITVSGDASGSGTTAIALTLANSGVTAGTYTKVTVDAKGRVTVGASLTSSDITTVLGYTPYNGTTNPNGYISGNQSITVTGDATGNGTTSIALTLANSGVSAGTYTKVTVDAKGRVTVGTNPTTLAGFGITDALNSISGGSVGGNITMTSGATVTGVPNPVNPLDVVNKQSLDAAISGIANGTSWKANAQAASTANLTLSGTQTIDGYAAQVGDRVLAKNQTNPVENGVYVVASGAWTRSTDTDTGAEIQGMAILILNGTTNALSQWVNTNSTAPVIGTDPVTYTELAAPATTYTAGTGLTLTGNQFSITNTGVSAGTYTKVTVNTQGQVTTGANLNSSDVTTALGFTPYNSTNPSGYISANQNITVSGDASGSGTTAITLTLANSGVSAGTYKSVTVNAKGLVTAGTNPTTLAGFGITDALALAGGTMTGNITMSGGATVTGVPTPVGGTDVANKSYTDTGDTNTLNAVPWKQVVQVASTANLTLSGTQTIDGYSAQIGDRVLAKDQTTASQNGIYVVASGAWTRAVDATSGAQLLNQIVMVLNGTANAHTQWLNTNTSAITVGTTSVTYAQTSGASGATTLTGDVTGSGTGSIATTLANSGVTAGTYTKVTVDAKGRVTVGASLASADVTTALGYTPYNGTTNPNGYISGNQTVTLSGDATGSGTTAITVTLANSGVSAGTYTKVTVDAKGRVTVGASLASTDVTTALGFTPANKAGDTFSGTVNFAPLVNVTAAATTAIGAAASNTINILGSTTITAFDTIAAGAYRKLIFAATPVLTYNATSLILPTAANITAAAGDVAEFVSLGSGNWKCTSYTTASGQALAGAADPTKLPLAGGTMSGAINGAPPVTLASASTVNIGAAAANEIVVTGTTTIVAFDTIAAGAVRTIEFTGALTLTYNATSLILPGAANITTAAGDVAQFTSLGSGNWRCEFYTKANGQAVVTTSSVTSVFGQTGAVPNLSGDVTTTGSSVTTLANSGVSAGTYSKVTVDAKGRVTVGANIASGDVTTALGYTPVNKAGDSMTGTLNGAPTVNVASAATTLIGSATANDINITGSTTITAFDSAPAGSMRTLNFINALTLTYNASNLILPGAANITTAANDQAIFMSKGGGTWLCISYLKANGQAVVGGTYTAGTGLTLTGNQFSITNTVSAGTYTKVTVNAQGQVTTGAAIASSDVTTALGYTPANKAGDTFSGAVNFATTVTLASAATVNIGAAAANDISITGTTTITAFDTIAAGAVRKVTFTGALTLTYNAASLILPTSANITTAAGDGAQFTSLGGGNWRCDYYQKRDGSPLVASSGTYNTTQTFNGSSSLMAMRITNAAEIMNVVAGAVPASSNLYAASGALQLYTSNTAANWTINISFSAGTTLNTAMSIGDAITITQMATQGASAFFPTAFTVDGSAVTPKWQGGVAPTAGNPSGIDAYTFTVIKTAAATFTVIAAQVQYK